MKKSIFLLAIIGTLIGTLTAGWVIFTSFNNNFSFEGLSLNLNLINQVGVFKNSSTPLGRRANGGSNSNQNESYLVGYNNEGDLAPLVYLNDENDEVKVPYSVFSFEVVGDFSYIVYYNSKDKFVLSSFESTITESLKFNSYLTRSLESTQFEVLLKQHGGGQINGIQAFVILHNQSGKLFDAVKTMELYPYQYENGFASVGLLLFTPLENKIIYFARRQNTCKGELEFNELDNTLTKTEVCSPLNIKPIFVHETGYFVYTFNNEVFFASPDFSITGNLTSYFVTSTPDRNMVFKSVGENIVMISGKSVSSFVVFDGSFSLIEEKNEVLEGGNNLSNFAWLFSKNGYDYFSKEGDFTVLHYVNFQTFDYRSLIETPTDFPALPQYWPSHKYIVYEGRLYQLGENIRVLEDNNSFSILEQNVYEVTNDINLMIKTGYLEYTQTQGLSQINKSLNLKTGEIYLQSESRPVITITQVQPIN
jgi:hypothetical protein